ncbi:MAG: response regulator [Chloroflexota bacterium]|nr:response regulator [Anaerolineales bacterium]MCB8967949.1 response regulator [Ardenticatenaceae bacterium]
MSHYIVIADDDPVARRVLRNVLEQNGFRVAEASDGEEALAVVREYQPRLLVLDVCMPKLNGLQVCHRLREVTSCPPRIMMLSAQSRLEDIRTGLVNGADAYMTKPIRVEEIIREVHAILA